MKITSIRAVHYGVHEVVTLWIDGKNTGSLVVGEGEGAQLVALLKEASAHAETRTKLEGKIARLESELEAQHTLRPMQLCTPADRAVLDAMASVPLEAVKRNITSAKRLANRTIWRAELARRGEKP